MFLDFSVCGGEGVCCGRWYSDLRDQLISFDWLILKASQPIILCLEVRELHSWYIYIYILLCGSFLRVFFTHGYEYFLKRSMWLIDWTLTGTPINLSCHGY